jgi:hypothetical protein
MGIMVLTYRFYVYIGTGSVDPYSQTDMSIVIAMDMSVWTYQSPDPVPEVAGTGRPLSPDRYTDFPFSIIPPFLPDP